MEPIEIIEGFVAPMPARNIDTDAIIPAQCLRSPSFNLADGLFLHWRFDQAHAERPDFILNRTPFREAKILIAGDNFGCGSSREHAVWALKGFGIRCVIATSFGEIFFYNCFKNGLLPIVVSEAAYAAIISQASETPRTMKVDLRKQSLVVGDLSLDFEVDPQRRHMLLMGLDDIGLTMQRLDQIRAFREADRAARPWVYTVMSADR